MYNINRKLLQKKRNNSISKEERQQIIASFKEVNDEDKILLLISHLNGTQFRASKDILHNTFYQLKKAFPIHFENFIFTENENYHFCKKIDDIFFRFQSYRAISMVNPDYMKYIITTKTKNLIKKESKLRFQLKNRDFLEDFGGMVEIIRSKLETNE